MKNRIINQKWEEIYATKCLRFEARMMEKVLSANKQHLEGKFLSLIIFIVPSY